MPFGFKMKDCMDYFSTQCSETFHTFARDGEDQIQAYHISGDAYILCESAEFRFSGMINEELDRLVMCPWCGKTVEEQHIRGCSNYKPAYTESEIRDSLSDPTEHAKRDSLLGVAAFVSGDQ